MNRLFLALTILFLVGACDKKPANPAAEYGNVMTDSYKRSQEAGEKATLDAIKNAVQAYHAANDKYPEDLESIKGLMRSDVDLSRYSYDPETGVVVIKK